MLFDQVCIVGVGLMGGSLGLALKRAKLAGRVVGVARTEATLEAARARGAVDVALHDPVSGCQGVDAVFVATPVSFIGGVVKTVGPHLKPGCLVSDLGSAKVKVMEEVKEAKGDFHFVGGHPMAGSDRTGVMNARADMFRNTVYFLTPREDTPSEMLASLSDLVLRIGAIPTVLPADRHDHAVAFSSHLPHLTAAILVRLAMDEMAEESAVRRAIGKGFLDTTRIAQGEPAMWADICLANRANLLKALEHMEKAIVGVRDMLAGYQPAELTQWLKDVGKGREDLAGE